MKKEELLNFYLQHRIYIFPAVVALSGLILIISVIYPQTIKLIRNQNAQGDLLNKSKFLEVKAQTLANIDSQNLKEKLDVALDVYPTDKDFLSVIGLLQNLCNQLGFNVISMGLETNAVKGGGIQSYRLKLDVIGPSTFLPSLLSRIENSPRLMKVSTIESSTNRENSAALVINIDVFYSSAPTAFGSTDSPLPEISQKDEEIIARLAKAGTSNIAQPSSGSLSPRGKVNPFE